MYVSDVLLHGPFEVLRFENSRVGHHSSIPILMAFLLTAPWADTKTMASSSSMSGRTAAGGPLNDPSFERWIRKKELLERGLEVSTLMLHFTQSSNHERCLTFLFKSGAHLSRRLSDIHSMWSFCGSCSIALMRRGVRTRTNGRAWQWLSRLSSGTIC